MIEIVCEKGHEEKRPVSHTFTDCDGEFVFGPLCHNKMYEIQLWVDNVKCAKCEHRDEECLKGIDMDSCKDLRPVCCDKEQCEKKCDDKCHK